MTQTPPKSGRNNTNNTTLLYYTRTFSYLHFRLQAIFKTHLAVTMHFYARAWVWARGCNNAQGRVECKFEVNGQVLEYRLHRRLATKSALRHNHQTMFPCFQLKAGSQCDTGAASVMGIVFFISQILFLVSNFLIIWMVGHWRRYWRQCHNVNQALVHTCQLRLHFSTWCTPKYALCYLIPLSHDQVYGVNLQWNIQFYSVCACKCMHRRVIVMPR